jgi:hypothetical protein
MTAAAAESRVAGVAGDDVRPAEIVGLFALDIMGSRWRGEPRRGIGSSPDALRP